LCPSRSLRLAPCLRLHKGGSAFVRNPSGGAFNRWFDIDTPWYWQSFDVFDRNAGAVFWQIG